MTNDYFTVTNYHLNIAMTYGEQTAKNQIERGHDEPLTEPELWTEHEPDELVFSVTGEKIHDVEESYLILDAFEEGYYYYDGWEN